MDYPETEGTWRTPNGASVAFRYRQNTNDWNTLTASLDQDEYGLRGIALSGPVVDVGGYLGSVGIGIAVDHPDVRVTIVEPVPANADLIEYNAQRNGVESRVRVLRGAVGKGREKVRVWHGYRGTEVAEHHAFVGNSSLAYNDGGMLPHDETEYRAIGLSDLTDELGEISLLKIDCEGGEWAFLTGPALSKVSRIVGEAHSVRGKQGGDIVALLAKTHDVTLSGDPEGTCEFTAVRR